MYWKMALDPRLQPPLSKMACIDVAGLFFMSKPATTSMVRPRLKPCHVACPSPKSLAIFLMSTMSDGFTSWNNLSRRPGLSLTSLRRMHGPQTKKPFGRYIPQMQCRLISDGFSVFFRRRSAIVTIKFLMMTSECQNSPVGSCCLTPDWSGNPSDWARSWYV